jgi:hypothetical protein
MPRSGTKLLREILNNHSLIAIPDNESHCIPFFYDKINKYGSLSSVINFERFYEDFSETIFFKRLIQKINFIDKESWYNSITDHTYSGVIEAFYQSYTRRKNKTIWGDKTPSYLLHLPLLKSLFPESKFIHIIRDVRDYCLSIHKAWKKNIYRAAQRWHDSIIKCRKDAKEIDHFDYYEIQYENLIDRPEETAISICDFLSISYEENMIKPKRPIENIGDAKEFVGILERNYGKWENEIKSISIKKIERMCGSLLMELGYSVSYNGNAKRLSWFEMTIYQILDAFNILRSGVKIQSLREYLRYIKKINIHRTVSKG